MTEKTSLSDWDKKEVVTNVFFLVLASLSVGSGLMAINHYPPLNGFSLFWYSLWFSIPAFCIFRFFIVRYLSGFPESKDTITKVLIMASVLFLILGWGIISYSNGFLDLKPAKKYTVPILNLYYNRGTYYPGWSVTVNAKALGSSDPLTFSIPTSDYEMIEHKDKCGITIKSGFWGFQWLGSHHCN